jgi:hypothetical protein
MKDTFLDRPKNEKWAIVNRRTHHLALLPTMVTHTDALQEAGPKALLHTDEPIRKQYNTFEFNARGMSGQFRPDRNVDTSSSSSSSSSSGSRFRGRLRGRGG